ncbi:MAG: hypothetical protein H7X93_13715 [Sphingomonadaceae bacterium]|nr:hypothetical protein [Sphingomonadaceae bacterium]
MPKTQSPDYSAKTLDDGEEIGVGSYEEKPFVEPYTEEKSVAGKIGDGAKSAIGKVGESAKYAGDKTAEGAKFAAQKVGDGAKSAGAFVKNNPIKTAAAIGGVAVAAGAAIAGAKYYGKRQGGKGDSDAVDKRTSGKAKGPRIDPQAE